MIEPQRRVGRPAPARKVSCGICAFCGFPSRLSILTLTLSIVLVAASVLPTTAQSTRNPDLIRVASWNIGGVTDGSGQDARIMAEHLKILRLDILALNHIDGNQERRNGQLEAIFSQANDREGNNWDYILFANKNVSDRSNLTGVAWNADRVTIESEVFRAAVDEDQRWQKPPNAAKFSAGPGLTDIVVMPVQLDPKSREADCLAGKRGEEASDLRNHIQTATTHFGDDDIIVIGDTDCVRDDPGQRQVFSTERVLEFESGDVAGFASGRASYNQVMVPLDQPEFTRSRGYAVVEAASQKAERPFSDHFLLLGPIEVNPDDD